MLKILSCRNYIFLFKMCFIIYYYNDKKAINKESKEKKINKVN